MRTWWFNKREISPHICACCKVLTLWWVGKLCDENGWVLMCDKCD